MSLETLLEAVNYVEKKETTAGNDKKTISTSPEMTSASSKVGSNQAKSNGTIKHWRKRAVAQSVLESQNAESKKIDQQTILCRTVPADSAPLQNSNVKTASVMSPGHVRCAKMPVAFQDPSNVQQGCSISGTAAQFYHHPKPVAFPLSGSGRSHAEVKICQRDAETSAQPWFVPSDRMVHDNMPRVTTTTVFQSFPSMMGHFMNGTYQQSGGSWSNSEMLATTVVPSTPSLQSSTGSKVRTDFLTNAQMIEVKKADLLSFADEPAPKQNVVPTSSDAGTHPSLRPDILKDDLASSREFLSSDSLYGKDKLKTQPGAVTREAHNLLEKNRRAHLKECFDNLRHIVPGLGTKKVSNLTILREALKYIQTLKRKEQKQEHDVESLVREKIVKKEKLSQLCRDLGSCLGKDKIDEILKNSENNYEEIKKIVSPLKTAAVMTDIQTAHVTKDHTRDRPEVSATAGAIYSGGPAPGQTTAALSSSFLSQLIDRQALSTAGKMHSVSGAPVPIQAATTERREFAFSNIENAVSLPSVANASYVLPNSTLSQQITPWQNDNTGTFGKAQVSHSLPVSTALPSQETDGLNSAAINRRQQLVGRLSQISANPADAMVFPHVEPHILSATSHRVSSIRAFTNKVPTTGIRSFIDAGTVPSQLKIVVKHVESAKQQARVVKQPKNDAAKNTTTEPSKVSKQGTGRTRTTELIFRPRSSVTPPPPSKIMPYFPRFSVGSGGSPPLTTVLPNQGETALKSEEEDERQEQMLRRDQLKMWAAMSVAESSFHNHAPQTPKRKTTNPLDRGPVPKFPKANLFQRQPASDAISQVSNTGGTVSASPSPAINSETDSETETKLNSATVTDAMRTMAVSSATLLNSLPSLPNTALMFPRIHSQNTESVTQVCYSTLMKAVRPAVSSTLFPASNKSQMTWDEKKAGSSTTTVHSKEEHVMPQLPIMSPSMQVAGGFRSQIPQVAYQVMHPAFMNPTVIQPPVFNASTVSATSNINGSESNGDRPNESAFTSCSNTTNKSESGVQITIQKTTQQVGNAAQAQTQIQYVIPMGYAGMVGGGGAAPMGFSPAMGGFMQLAPMPQGHGWSYVVPQNMVFAQTTKNSEVVNSVGNNTLTLKQIDDAGRKPVTETTAKSGDSDSEVQKKAVGASISTSESVHGKFSNVPQSQLQDTKFDASSLNANASTLAKNTNLASWPTQTTVKPFQPQFQIVSPNFQPGGQIMIPMGSNGPGAGYMIGGAPTMMSAPQGVMGSGRADNSMGYGIPMNIVGYPVQLAGTAPVQFAAIPNGSMSFQRGFPYGIPAQFMAVDDGKQPRQGGGADVENDGAGTQTTKN